MNAEEPVVIDDPHPESPGGELAIEAAGIGTFDWDVVSGELVWDERLLALFGYDATSFDGSIDGFFSRVHADDRERVRHALRRSLDTCSDYEANYRIVLPEGRTRWITARGRTLCDTDGAAVRLLGAAYDITEQHPADHAVARVLDDMPAGFYTLDHDWRFTYVNAEAERRLGRDRDALVGQVVWDSFPAAAGSVFEQRFRDAVASGEPVSFDAYYPPPLDGWFELRAWPTDDGLSVYFVDVTERRQALARAERAAAHLALRAQVSSELAGLDATRATVHRLPRLVVPALADGAVVTLLDTDTGHARDVGTWHTDARSRGLLTRYAEHRLTAVATLPAVARALDTGEPLRLDRDGALALTAPAEARELLAQVSSAQTISVPIRGRGRALGLMTLLYGPHREPGSDEIATAQDIADRAGLALDNALLYGQQRQVAEELQRAMLTPPPEPDHAEIAVRYLPATQTVAVGGDWYDAFLQPDGNTMIVIGDVAGHDITAAATMGQLRSLLRGAATAGEHGPAEVLTTLDRSLALLEVHTLATACVARFEQTPEERAAGTSRICWTNAGHPAPMLLNPDGTVVPLSGERTDLPLGVDPTTDRHQYVTTIERGATVFLYTDGLIERRDSDLDAGTERLRQALAHFADQPLQQLCDLVIDRLVQGRPADDVAVVAVRLHRQDQPRPAEAGPVVVPSIVT